MTTAEVDQRALVEERMRQNEVDRLLALEKRKQERQDSEDPSESIEKFDALFREKRSFCIQTLGSLVEKKLAGTKMVVDEVIAPVVGAVDELSQALSTASYFLPSYDLRQKQEQINKLREEIQRCKQTLAPRKKFSFSSRAKSKPSVKSTDSSGEASSSSITPHLVSVDKSVGIALSEKDKVVLDDPSVQLLEDRHNEVIVYPLNSLGQVDLRIRSVSNCTIIIADCLKSLFLKDIENCQIFTAPIAGSALVYNIKGSTFCAAAWQFRIHDAVSVDLYVWARSGPIIENCQEMRFAPYALTHASLADQLENCQMGGGKQNLWLNVEDFNWLRVGQSENWSILPESERKDAQSLLGEHAPVFV